MSASAWVPGCWHTLFRPDVVARFYRDKERRASRPPVTPDAFGCPALRPDPAEEPPAPGPDALDEVVSVIVERLLPAVVPRLVEMLVPLLEKRLALTAAQIVLKTLEGGGNGRQRNGTDCRQPAGRGRETA